MSILLYCSTFIMHDFTVKKLLLLQLQFEHYVQRKSREGEWRVAKEGVSAYTGGLLL